MAGTQGPETKGLTNRTERPQTLDLEGSPTQRRDPSTVQKKLALSQKASPGTREQAKARFSPGRPDHQACKSCEGPFDCKL